MNGSLVTLKQKRNRFIPETIDIHNPETWKTLKQLRTEIRDRLFDNEDTMREEDIIRLSSELENLETRIRNGETLDIPW